MIALARKTLRHEWRRFVPSIFAVGFSGVLLAMQAALVLGIFGSAALYVTASGADLWLGYPGTQSVNFGRTIGADVEMRLRMEPGVAAVEAYQWVDGDWHAAGPTSASTSSPEAEAGAGAGGVSIYLSGISTAPGALMFSRVLSGWQRERLKAPGAVIVDRADLASLGTHEDGTAWINGHRVRVVAVAAGLRGLGGANVLASLETAREIAGLDARQGATYFLAATAAGVDPTVVRERLRASGRGGFGPYEAWTATEFAHRSQRYWMFDTGAGAGVLFMAIVVCLVGSVVTSQSLRTVVLGSAREYAMLNALGVSRAALGRVVVEQSLWIGLLGFALAGLASAALLTLASAYHVPVALSGLAVAACAALVAVLSLLSGLGAVRGVLRADPASLLR